MYSVEIPNRIRPESLDLAVDDMLHRLREQRNRVDHAIREVEARLARLRTPESSESQPATEC